MEIKIYDIIPSVDNSLGINDYEIYAFVTTKENVFEINFTWTRYEHETTPSIEDCEDYIKQNLLEVGD